jgi:hypothetical protein
MGISVHDTALHDTAFILLKYHYSLILFTMIKSVVLVKRFSVCLTLMVLLASVSAITALMLTTITETIHVHGQVGTGIQSIKAAYSVEIVP